MAELVIEPEERREERKKRLREQYKRLGKLYRPERESD